MPANTSPDNIQYPVPGDQIAPLNAIFQNLAESTQTALTALASDIGGPWAPYTPAFAGFTLGNGTVDAAYTQIGKTVHYRCLITFGSTTAITGTVTVSHPVTAEVGESVMPTVLYRPDAGGFYLGMVTPNGAVSSIMRVPVQTSGGDMVASSITATVPITWATGGTISIAGTYEAS